MHFEAVASDLFRTVETDFAGNDDRLLSVNSYYTQKLLSDFKCRLLNVSEGCPRSGLKTFKSFLTKETLNTIDDCRSAGLEGNPGQYRELNRECVHAVRKNEEGQIR